MVVKSGTKKLLIKKTKLAIMSTQITNVLENKPTKDGILILNIISEFSKVKN